MTGQSKTELGAKCSNTGCKKGSSDDLLRCGACMTARYCSKDCQKQHWKNHKLFCKHVTSNGASSASLDPLVYYEKIKVQALSRDMGLGLPCPCEDFHGLKMPMRRLVATGKDTPENISLFFGRKKDDTIDGCHKDNRIEVLLRPPRGSSLYVVSTSQNLDENCPPWTPREPSQAEVQQLKEINTMQETIRRHMGSRDVKDIDGADMRDILVKNFGNRWPDGVKTYEYALNSMYRGIQV
ncbi:hypothetical protein AAE478_008042 [Parahypoxylon ruwenzoriense]